MKTGFSMATSVEVGLAAKPWRAISFATSSPFTMPRMR